MNIVSSDQTVIGTTVVEGDESSLLWVVIVAVIVGTVFFFVNKLDKKSREKAIHVYTYVQQEGLVESLEKAQNYEERKYIVLGIPGIEEYKSFIDKHLINHFYNVPIDDVVLEYSIPGNQEHSQRLEYIRSAAKKVWNNVSLFRREKFLRHSQTSLQYIVRQGYSPEDSQLIYNEILRQEYEREKKLARNNRRNSRSRR